MEPEQAAVVATRDRSRQAFLLHARLGHGHRPHGNVFAERALRQDSSRGHPYRRADLHRLRRGDSGA